MQVYGADILTSTHPPSPPPQLEPHAQNTILKQQSKSDHVFCTSSAVDSAISQKQRKYASEQKLRKQAGLSRATLKCWAEQRCADIAMCPLLMALCFFFLSFFFSPLYPDVNFFPEGFIVVF
jgi:hypothetical protein